MRWSGLAALGVVAVLGTGAFFGPREAKPPPESPGLSVPTQFAPPNDPRGDEAVLRLAFSADLRSAHAATFELARERRLADTWRDEGALGSRAALAPPVALPEPSFAALAAGAALIAGATRRRAPRERAGSEDATRPLLPH